MVQPAEPSFRLGMMLIPELGLVVFKAVNLKRIKVCLINNEIRIAVRNEISRLMNIKMNLSSKYPTTPGKYNIEIVSPAHALCTQTSLEAETAAFPARVFDSHD